MVHTFYIVCEEGMDRPLVWHHAPPSTSNKPRKVYRVEVPLPDVVRVDGVIRLNAASVIETMMPTRSQPFDEAEPPASTPRT